MSARDEGLLNEIGMKWIGNLKTTFWFPEALHDLVP